MKTRLKTFLSLLFCLTICFTACDKDDVTLSDFEQHIVGNWQYKTVGFIIEGQELSIEQFAKLFNLPEGSELEFEEEMSLGEISISFDENHEGSIIYDDDDNALITWKLIDDDRVEITDKSNPNNKMIFVRSGNSIYFDVSAEDFGFEADNEMFETMRIYLKKE